MNELTQTQMWVLGGAAVVVWALTSAYFESVVRGLRRETNLARTEAKTALEASERLHASELMRMQRDLDRTTDRLEALAKNQHSREDHARFSDEIRSLIREQGMALKEAIRDLAATNKEALEGLAHKVEELRS